MSLVEMFERAVADNHYLDRNFENEDRFKEAVADAKAKIEAFETGPALEVGPFNDDLTKDEMIAHLLEAHATAGHRYMTVDGHQVSKNGTKATKAGLTRYHERLHENIDALAASETVRVSVDVTSGEYDATARTHSYIVRAQFNGRELPAMNHRHGVPVLSDEQSKVVAAVRSNQKVNGSALSVTDRKVLKELVDNDFNGLKQEMRAFASDTLSHTKSEINADWDSKEAKIPDFATEATTLYRAQQAEYAAMHAKVQQQLRDLKEKHEDAFKKVTDKASTKGVVLKKGEVSETNQTTGQREVKVAFSAEVEGRNDAIKAAERENQQMLERALMTLEKQRLTAQRQVLLTGVPDVALPIVESIPDAKSMMVDAQKDGSLPQIESKSTS